MQVESCPLILGQLGECVGQATSLFSRHGLLAGRGRVVRKNPFQTNGRIVQSGIKGTFPRDVPPWSESLASLLGNGVYQNGSQPRSTFGIVLTAALVTLGVRTEQTFLDQVARLQSAAEAAVHPATREGQQMRLVEMGRQVRGVGAGYHSLGS